MVNLINALISGAPEITNIIGKLVHWMYSGIGNFGWTVVAFTVLLKLVLSPLDFWQKKTTRKNNKAMKLINPEMEKLRKIHAGSPEIIQQKQMELYKKYGYSMLGGCLPALLTLVVFLVIFAGFNAAIRYENELMVYNMTEEYVALVDENPTMTADEIDTRMIAVYDDYRESWLWVKNVFMADTWANPVPDWDAFVGSGLGKLNANLPDNTRDLSLSRSNYDNGYETILQPAMNSYNRTSFFDFAHWNGYMILPILSIFLSIMSVKLSKTSQPEMPAQYDAAGNPVKTGNGTMKIMQWTMPVMIGVFSLFYSAAFCIYMFVNSLITVTFNLLYNKITVKIDNRMEDERLRTTFKRG